MILSNIGTALGYGAAWYAGSQIASMLFHRKWSPNNVVVKEAYVAAVSAFLVLCAHT